MAENNEGEQTTTNEGISEDELKGLISTSLDEKLEERGMTKDVLSKLGKLDLLDSLEGLFEKHKSSPVDKEGLLGEIGKLIDDKIKGISSGGGSQGGNGGSTERQPKIRIFN